jgi:hypothetical protein
LQYFLSKKLFRIFFSSLAWNFHQRAVLASWHLKNITHAEGFAEGKKEVISKVIFKRFIALNFSLLLQLFIRWNFQGSIQK